MQSSSPSTPAGVPPLAREISKQVWQLTLPIPFPLNTVNVYALVGSTGWVLIDAAIGTPETRTAFYAGIAQAGLALKDLQAIVLTHEHPDHIGLSGEVQAISGAPVYMHPLATKNVHALWSHEMGAHFHKSARFLAQHGLTPVELWYTQTPPELLRTILQIPPRETFLPLVDQQELRLADENYRIHWVPGHADGQIVLFRERDGLFISADHVLPRITPNIGLFSSENRPDPLGDYLSSLAKITTLPAATILPGHGETFGQLTKRIAEIVEHHQKRLAQIIALLAKQPQHANQLTDNLFGARIKGDESRRLAVAEVLAHLEYLRLREQLMQQRTQAGILYYIVS